MLTKRLLALLAIAVSLNAHAIIKSLGSSAGGSGASSVGLADGSSTPIYSITNSPVTSSGTLTFTLNNQLANLFFAAPPGSSGQPSFRAILAADLPSSITSNTTGTAAGLSATLGAAIGGTGLTSYAIGDLLQATASTTLASLADVATGKVLCSGGVTTAPSYCNPNASILTSTATTAAAWTTTGIGLALPATTYTDNSSSGTITNESFYVFGAPTLTTPTNAITVTSLVNLYVPAPIAGTHVTASTAYGILTTGVLGSTGGTLLNGTNNLNTNQNAATNINSGSSTGQITIGNSGTTGKTVLAGISTGTNADFLCLSSGGVVLLQTSACTISSLRFKEHVLPWQADSLSELMQIKTFTYNLKATGNRDPNATSKQIGITAEEVAKIEPKCSIYERDMKTPKSYRQECLIAMLIKGMQEQQAEIKSLKRRFIRSLRNNP